jgi:hypothetical protein
MYYLTAYGKLRHHVVEMAPVVNTYIYKLYKEVNSTMKKLKILYETFLFVHTLHKIKFLPLLHFFQFYSATPFRLRYYVHPKLYIFNRSIFSRFDLVMCQKYRKCDFHRQHGVLVTCKKITFLLYPPTKNCGKS